MLDAAVEGTFRALYIQGEDILQSDPDTHHVAAGLAAMDCVVVQDLFLNETANYAHVFLPGSTFLEKDGTFTNAERRIQPVRRVMAPKNGYADWEITQLIARAVGLDWHYAHPSEIMDEIARLTPTFAGVTYAKLDAEGSIQWPCNAEHPLGFPIMHTEDFTRGKGRFMLTEYVPDRRAHRPALPADPDHRPHPQPVQCRRPDPAHRQRALAHRGPPRDPPPRRRAARHPRRRLGHRPQPRRRDRPARARSPSAWRRAWSTPPSTTR